MALVESASYSHHNSATIHGSREPSWLNAVLSGSSTCNHPDEKRTAVDYLDLAAELKELHVDDIEATQKLERAETFDIAQIEAKLDADTVPLERVNKHSEYTSNTEHHLHGPFKKWMKSLHRRAAQRPSILKRHHLHRDSLEPSEYGSAGLSRHCRRRPSSSGSSFGFVAAVRSASVSLASVSSVARSKRNMGRSRGFSRTDRSSRASMSIARMSEDSAITEKTARIDCAAKERSSQRRRVLEEIITTEEGYISDVRFLINVYITILASLPSQAVGLRSSINRNLTEMVELHEDILGELHRVVPDSEYSQADVQPAFPIPTSPAYPQHCGHRRWKSLDAVPENDANILWPQEEPGLLADPQIAADVARIFGKRMNRFFIYKEYGAKYDMMTADINAASTSMPEWESYQKGLEALASTVGSANSNSDTMKKSLTLSDLLMKPIQRICKYPLLFSELLKYTAVSDCPNSHMEVESTLTRLREATAEINRATDDAHVRRTLEKTWLLQDRLVFPHRKLDAATRNQIRSFGRIQLCGALHVCWQSRVSIEGQYMICLLYRDVLCLASAGKVDPIYTVMACISLHGARIEDIDNGRGLQCHTAPFSWKMVFECDCELYEIIMTACSPKEEEEWKKRLGEMGKEGKELAPSGDATVFSSTELDIKSLGTVYGKQGTIARRLSIHRATTVSPKSPMCQVVLKNTCASRDGPNSSTGGTSVAINRSQSLLTTNARLPVLAPARAGRARLETMLADVWSRDVLPFPGISSRSRSEHLVRASSVMRKLSMASLTESFNKRSGSLGRRIAVQAEDNLDHEGVFYGTNAADCGHDSTFKRPPPVRTRNGHAEETGTVKRSKIQKRIASRGEDAPFRSQDCPNNHGTIRPIKPAKEVSSTQAPVEALKADAKPASVPSEVAINDMQPTTSNVSSMATVAEKCLEKENSLEAAAGKTVSRWARMGLNRNDSKTHGFRSLFR